MLTSKNAINSRTGKTTINFVTGFLSQFVVLILNFVVRYIFIRTLGYNYLGINSLFSSILTILSVADLGFGSALGIVLYSSLAKKDEEEIAGVMHFFKNVYLVIGLIVTVSGLIVTPFIKYLVNTTEDIPNLSIYFLFFLANTVSSYFISYRAILIKADQKNFVVNNTTTVVKVLKAVFEGLILALFPKWFGLVPTYFSYLGVMVIATYAIGILTSAYAKKVYSFAFKNVKISSEKKNDIIFTTRDLFLYKVCNVFSMPIDNILISLLLGTAILGIYSNYLLIFTTLMEFVCLISRNTISSVGNFVVEKDIKEQKRLYFEIQALYFAVIIFCTVNFVSLATPFLNLVFGAESILSKWVVFLFGATLFLRCTREQSGIFRETTRIYRKTKYISLINTAVHIGLSILFGYLLGLEGILLGNVLAYFSTNFWYEIYALFKWHFKEAPLKPFLLYLYVIVVTVLASVCGYYLCSLFVSGSIENFIISCGISALASLIALLALYPLSGAKDAFNRVRNILKQISSKIKKLYENAKVQKILIILFFVTFIVSILVRDLAGLNIGKFVYLAFIVAFALLLKKDYALMAIMFVLPLSTSLAEIYIQSFLLVYLVLCNIKEYTWKKIITIFLIPVFLFAYELLISSIYGGISLHVALRILVLLSIISIIFYDRKVLSKRHVYSFLAGCVFLLIVLGLNWLLPAIYVLTHKGKGLNWLTLKHLFEEIRLGASVSEWIARVVHIEYPIKPLILVSENPNTVGMISLVGIACATSLIGTTKGRERIILFISILVFLLFGVWSQSRMFFICVALFVLVYLVFFVLTKRIMLIDAAIILCVFFTTVCLLFIINKDITDSIFRRFFGREEEKDGGRIRLLVSYFKFIFSNWKYALFGVGIANLKNVAGLAEVPHSNFIQFIAGFGILNFSAFVISVVFAWIRSKNKYKISDPKLLLVLPLLFIVIYTGVHQLFSPSIILICFIPTIICVSYLNKGAVKTIYYNPRLPVKLKNGDKIKLLFFANLRTAEEVEFTSGLVSLLKENNFEVAIITEKDDTVLLKNRLDFGFCKQFVYEEDTRLGKLRRLKRKQKFYKKALEEFSPNIIYIFSSSIKKCALAKTASKSSKISFCVLHSNGTNKLTFKDKLLRYFFIYDGDFKRISNSIDNGRTFFGRNFGKAKDDLVLPFITPSSIEDDGKEKSNLLEELKKIVYE